MLRTAEAAPTLAALLLTAQRNSLGGALAFALQWVVAATLVAWLSWKFLLWLMQRRGKPQPAQQGTLFIAIWLVTFAAANLSIEGRAFVPTNPLVFVAIQVLFLLYFMYFPDRRFAPLWTLWLTVFYTLSLMAAFIPQGQNQAQNQRNANVLNPPIPGVLGVLITVADAFAMLPIIIVILPQIALRFRRLTETGSPAIGAPSEPRLAQAVGIALAMFALYLMSGLLSTAPHTATSLPLIGAQSVFYLLMTVVPASIGLAALRAQRFDRQALVSRAQVHVPLSLCLLAVYTICVAALWLAFPGFRTITIAGYLPFLIIIVILMAGIFRPAQAYIQRYVDRRYYRERYDAAQLLSALGASLRDEVRLEPLSARCVTVIQKAMQPSATTLWLRTPPGALAHRSAAALAVLSGATGAEPAHSGVSLSETLLRRQALASQQPSATLPSTAPVELAIEQDDPARAALLRPASVVTIDRFDAASGVGRALHADGAAIALPLVSSGDLVGLLTLGQRQGGHPYTVDDCEPLVSLAEQMAPLLYAAQQAYEQDVATQLRERIEQELQTARRIQEALLPKTVPLLDGWRLATCYQPAHEVGGDFYDFISLAAGRLGIVLGDVTDKGMPAALVMATTRSMLRAVATQPGILPGQALAQVNELLCPDLPASMFVTCFYAILDPATGKLQFANAGQDLPYLRHADGTVRELWAAGMPLGLMSGMQYDEHETTVQPGENLLLYSDGLVEAHNPNREMFGFPRLMSLLSEQDQTSPLIVFLLQELANFTGANWEQEDDITLVAMHRVEGDEPGMTGATGAGGEDWRSLGRWTIASQPGNEREAIQRVQEAVLGLPLRPEQLDGLKSAVGEAAMNAMEHGNGYQSDLPVEVEALASREAVMVRITDQGGPFALSDAHPPDLDAKLAGLQTPRGWGLFLIERLVDEARVTDEGNQHTLELIVKLGRRPN